MLRSMGRVSLAALLTLALGGSAAAQTSTGGIRGVITDDSGAVLAGVTVEASSPARIGGAAVEVTNDQGLYRFENLPIGEYTVTFTPAGVHDDPPRRHPHRGRAHHRTAGQDGDRRPQRVADGQRRIAGRRHAARRPTRAASTARSSRTCRCCAPRGSTRSTFAPAVKANQVTGNSASFVIYGTNSEPELLPGERRRGLVAVGHGVGLRQPGLLRGGGGHRHRRVGRVHAASRAASSTSSPRAAANNFRGLEQHLLHQRLDGGVERLPGCRHGPIPYYIDYTQDYRFSLGGPIVKDKRVVLHHAARDPPPRLEHRRRSAVRRRDACLPSLRQGDGAVVVDKTRSTSRSTTTSSTRRMRRRLPGR